MSSSHAISSPRTGTHKSGSVSTRTLADWHVLDCNSIWVKEFVSCLSRERATLGWMSEIRWTAAFENWTSEEAYPEPRFQAVRFPLQRGYSRAPISWFGGVGETLCAEIAARSREVTEATLVCTTPYYAPVAERWPGKVVYYLTDLTVAYAGADADLVRRLDQRMCRAASLVCPNSERIAQYLIADAACDPSKIVVVPNATRESNLLPAPLFEAAERPRDAADLKGPLAGVVGNLAANQDWVLLKETVDRTPEFSWLFVGPFDMPVYDPEHQQARSELLERGGRVRFVGAKPYSELASYARALDVAILPYLGVEPTYSGSSTRFYEHLAATRPMIATRGFEELLHKEPLVCLVDTAVEMASQMRRLGAQGFRDGHEWERQQAARQGTWECRAGEMAGALEARATAVVRVAATKPNQAIADAPISAPVSV